MGLIKKLMSKAGYSLYKEDNNSDQPYSTNLMESLQSTEKCVCVCVLT